MPYDVEHVRVSPKKYSNVRCCSCDIPLRNLNFDSCDFSSPTTTSGYLQPNDALIIKLEGGYGMMIDPFDETDDTLSVLLCRTCAIDLCEKCPPIKKIVQRNICSSIGHECTKERAFVWRPRNCCRLSCASCSCSPGYFPDIKRENENDVYSAMIGTCSSCKHYGRYDFAWEKTKDADGIHQVPEV